MTIQLSFGIRWEANSTMSRQSRNVPSQGKNLAIVSCGPPLIWNSGSFCWVPTTRSSGTPRRCATSASIASDTADTGGRIDSDADTLSGLKPSKIVSMSSSVEIDTPVTPTSPSAISSSASNPYDVGRSIVRMNPPWPSPNRYLRRSLVSAGVPNPTCTRRVHSRPRYMSGYTPRVNGYSPGSPSCSS